MSIDEVREIISNLAESVGFYGRLYKALESNRDGIAWEKFTETINKNNCKNSLDVIMLIEGN